MKILLTGGTGLLGTSFTGLLNKGKNQLAITYLKNKPSEKGFASVKMDLSNKREIQSTIQSIKPGLIIHTAAATNIEWCEANPKEAFQINSDATETIVEVASKLGAKVVYISTDFVFDGQKGNYTEEDRPNPINVYGKSKLKGELAVLKDQKNLVVRTNIYGIDPLPDKQSFAAFIVSSLKAGKQITAADDQFCNQIFAGQLSKYIMEMVDSGMEGLFHLSTKDSSSRYGFAMQVCDIFGLDKALVKRAKLADLVSMFKWKAKRPQNTSFEVGKLGKTFKLPTIKTSLEAYKKEMENNL